MSVTHDKQEPETQKESSGRVNIQGGVHVTLNITLNLGKPADEDAYVGIPSTVLLDSLGDMDFLRGVLPPEIVEMMEETGGARFGFSTNADLEALREKVARRRRQQAEDGDKPTCGGCGGGCGCHAASGKEPVHDQVVDDPGSEPVVPRTAQAAATGEGAGPAAPADETGEE